MLVTSKNRQVGVIIFSKPQEKMSEKQWTLYLKSQAKRKTQWFTNKDHIVSKQTNISQSESCIF